jgi:hypothetical protein
MPGPPLSPRRSRWQFGLKGLLLVMLVVAVGAASTSYLISPEGNAAPRRLIGMLMLLTAPLLLMTLLSLLRFLGQHDR